MSYPIFGNLSLGNVSGNIKLFVNHSGIGNLTGIGYNNNAMTFGVNQSATDTPEMIINRIGDVDILGNVFTGGNVVVNAIAPSTSTTTGALIVSGGAGIGGNVYTGADAFINSVRVGRGRNNYSTNTVVGFDALVNNNTAQNCTAIGYEALHSNTDQASSTALGYRAGYTGGSGFQNTFLGTLTSGGGFNTSTAIGFGSTITASNQVVLGRATESVFIPGTTASQSTTTGALRVAGGAGIIGNIFLGGNLITGGDVDCNGNIQIDSIFPSISTTTGALRVAGGAGIRGNIFLGGNLITNGDIDCNGNIDIRFPITTTYTALPTFTNTQIGYTMNQSARTSSGTAVSLNTAASLANIILPVAGVWLINYTGGLNLTVAAATAGNVTFGLHPSSASIAPIIGNIKFSFPATVLPLASPAFQGTGSYVHSGASTTYYLNYLVSGQTTWTTTLSTMTATRLA
jgi:hypothetical protein